MKQLIFALRKDEKRRLKHFSLSAVTFFVGYGMIHWCANNLPPSLEQEVLALGFVLLTGAAFGWGIFMQILFILNKILD